MENILRKACHNPSGFKFDEWKKQYDKIVNDGYSENPYQPPPRAKGPRGRIAKPAVLNLLDRFKQHSPSILRFIQNHIVPFTNNLAERNIRMVKVQQKISGTFRSWSGARMFARNRSYISTAIKQHESVFNALFLAVQNQPRFTPLKQLSYSDTGG